MGNLVSVIIPTYNRSRSLPRAVESARSQTHSDIEIVVVDDHSAKPASETLADSGVQADGIVQRHDENQGGNAARKTGIELATGDYLAFLDDDDEWRDTKIERQLQHAQRTGRSVVYTGVEQVANGSTIAKKTPDVVGDITEELFEGHFIGTFSTLFMERGLVGSVGYPDVALPSWHDWDYYIRLSHAAEFGAVPEPLVRRHSEGQQRISDNYTAKRETTAPRFLEKHRAEALDRGKLQQFQASVEGELGWSAIANKEYRHARRHFINSFSQHPSRRLIVPLALTAGGAATFVPVQMAKRKVVGAIS